MRVGVLLYPGVDRLAGGALAARTARQLDTDWDPSGVGAAA
jgi:hypothetical protein